MYIYINMVPCRRNSVFETSVRCIHYANLPIETGDVSFLIRYYNWISASPRSRIAVVHIAVNLICFPSPSYTVHNNIYHNVMYSYIIIL